MLVGPYEPASSRYHPGNAANAARGPGRRSSRDLPQAVTSYGYVSGVSTANETLAQPIPGTILFDGTEAMKGYALNKMCYSFNHRANRAAFLRDEEAYMTSYSLNAAQKDAVRRRNVLELLAAGGNIYYLAKFAGIFGLGVQDIGAQQTGMTVEQFKAKLSAAAL